MCGISGIINFKNKIDGEIVNSMNKTIKYRGPDHSSLWSNSYCSIGAVRLAIIDLSEKSNQPFLSKDKKISIIYNGEIYNFNELRKNFFIGKKFKSEGDGEVLLYLYEKFGIEFIKKIKGMFAIFISDERKKTTYLIRDRFGIKPLYYHFNYQQKELTFCSEIPGIFLNKKIQKNHYLCKGLVNATNETWFKDIYQVDPSHYLEFSEKGFNKIKYYSLEENVNENEDNSNSNFYLFLKKMRKKIDESFQQHTVFDVECGIHQSGGVDSAVIVALTKLANRNFDTFTFDYENKNFSEIENAKKLSTSANLKNFSSILKDNELEDYLIKVLGIQFEPFSSLRVVSHHHLYEKYKDKCKVILDGSGGDEIAAGYRYHSVAWYLDMLKDNNKQLEKKFLKLIQQHETLSISDYIKGSLKRLSQAGQATEDGSTYYDEKFLDKDFLSKNNTNLALRRPFKSYLRNAQYLDLMHLKLPRSLRYVDRASMRYGIESRLPLLDHEFVELCFNLPNKFKMIYGQQRAILKYLFRHHVDKSVLLNNKRTIADPQSFWLKNTLKNFVSDILHSQDFKSSGIFNSKNILKFYENFCKSNKHVNSFFLFQIINTVLWQKNILKN